MSTTDFTSRNAEILARRKAKETLESIAKSYGITAERVRQIVYREVTGKAANRKPYIPSPRALPPDLSSLPPFENPFNDAEERTG